MTQDVLHGPARGFKAELAEAMEPLDDHQRPEARRQDRL